MNFPIGRLRHSQRGQSTIELTLTVVFVMWAVFFMFEMISYVYTYNVLAYSAKEAVRFAVVHGAGNSCSSGSCTTGIVGAPDTTAIQNVATTAAKQSFHDVSGITVNVTYPDGSNAAPNRVQVVVSYTYVPYATLHWTPATMFATAEGRILN